MKSDRTNFDSNRMTESTYREDTDGAFIDGDDLHGIEDTMLEEFTSEKQETKLGGKRQLGWSSASPSGMPAGIKPGQGLASQDVTGEAFRKLPSIPTAAAGSSSSSSAPAPKSAGMTMCQTMSLSEDVGADLRVRPGTSGDQPLGRPPPGSTVKPLNTRVPAKAGAKASPRHQLPSRRLIGAQEAVERNASPAFRNASPAERNTSPARGSKNSPLHEGKKDEEVLERSTFAGTSMRDRRGSNGSNDEVQLKDLDIPARFFSAHSDESAGSARFYSNKSEGEESPSSPQGPSKPAGASSGRPSSRHNGRNLTTNLELQAPMQRQEMPRTPRAPANQPERAVKPLRRIRP